VRTVDSAVRVVVSDDTRVGAGPRDVQQMADSLTAARRCGTVTTDPHHPPEPSMAPLTLLAETAADLMHPGPVPLAAAATVAEAAGAGAAGSGPARGWGAAVVTDAAGPPLGVVTKPALLTHARQRGPPLETDPPRAQAVMPPAVFSVRRDPPAASVVAQFLAL